LCGPEQGPSPGDPFVEHIVVERFVEHFDSGGDIHVELVPKGGG
jgi:hypothetical protein